MSAWTAVLPLLALGFFLLGHTVILTAVFGGDHDELPLSERQFWGRKQRHNRAHTEQNNKCMSVSIGRVSSPLAAMLLIVASHGQVWSI